MQQNLISAVILSVGIAVGGYFIGNGIIKFKFSERMVTVKGMAEQIVSSDQATWNVRYAFSSDTLADLYTGILNSQEQVKKFMLAQGFSEKEIELQAVSVTDNQNNAYAPANEKVKRYVADSGVTVTTGKIEQAKLAVQKTLELINAGIIVNSSNISYEYTKLNEIKSKILDEATANAKKTALSFATNSNNKLGKIKSASQGQISIGESNPSGMSSEWSVNKTVRIVTTVTYLLD
ncbi:MAG: SIMPL domain-containing protein [Gammaproteobacteria bacterium]|nr:SIMPL domain-containing protein [Gammaproteobacteria bacterium]